MRKDLKSTSDLYVISRLEFDYNDEFSYVNGSSIRSYCKTETQAKFVCDGLNLKLCLEDDWRTHSDVETLTEDFTNRWTWYYEFVLDESPPIYIDIYEVMSYQINYHDLIDWCQENKLLLHDYLPRIFFYTKISPDKTNITAPNL